jgi:type II secretory pathway component PulF
VNQEEMAKMMTQVLSEVIAPHTEAVREALDAFTRLEVQIGYGERIARLEGRLDQIGDLEERLRKLEHRHG